MRKPILALAFLASLFASPASAKMRIVVLPGDFAGAKEELTGLIGETALGLKSDDHLLVFAARPVIRQLADIHVPSSPNAANPAWFKRKLGEQAAPVLRYIADLPNAATPEPPGNLMIPNLLDELARNVIPALPERSANVLLIGSLIYFDPRDRRYAMTDRYYPSDGMLQADPAKVPFSVVGRRERLSGIAVHYCTPDGKRHYVSEEHENAVKRFYALWTAAQSGRVGTFSDDVATCARRFIAGEASGQPTYRQKRDAKPEMLRARQPVPPGPPASPGHSFLRDDAPISRTPPTRTTGNAWIGLKWTAPCDVDLYARPDGGSPWLFYGNVRTDQGFFDKDWLGATADGQFEFVEFKEAIDLTKAEVAINLYAGTLPVGPQGVVRVWFDGNIYEAPFRLAARAGNEGRQPMAGANWLQVDLRKVVGLPKS